ncbi:MAG TPA: AAA family ATPase [Burkholderiaceae bacterium]|nr:AAA family ATPase [Burkholderiaceae bacterium]
MKDEHDLQLLVASRFPIIAIETHEEERALALLKRCVQRLRLGFGTWSVTKGLTTDTGGAAVPGTTDPAAALREVYRLSRPAVYAWLDFHPFLGNPLHVRLLKEIAVDYERAPRTLVLLGHEVVIPPEVEKLSVRFELSLPNRDAILRIVKAEVAEWQRRNAGRQLKGDKEMFDLMLRHLAGLPEVDIRRLVRHAFQDDGILDGDDLPRLIKQKHTILARDSVLSFEIDTARFADVAGLTALKNWLELRRPAFLDEAGAQGLDVPKGIMLLGVQGCGKSLAAKAVAGAWGVPLMRLDFGALYNKFLGETERNLREALKSADAMAPCVLWIDEIEKGVAGNDSGTDGGESRRVLGALLTWMAERKSRVFIVATSNDIAALPPELVRKGRLDEIFFVDLPDAAARAEIFRIHLRRRQQEPANFDLAALVDRTAGFSGAEIEQAVVAAMYEANAASAPLADEHLRAEIARTRPLSVVMAERIAYLRAWAADRTVKAD